MKKLVFSALAAGLLMTLPSSVVNAATNSSGPDTHSVIVLTNHHTLTKSDWDAMKAAELKTPQTYTTVIPNSLVQSADYQYHLVGTGYSDSPEFYHSSGQILVTLVQWSNSLFGTADLQWSVISAYSGTPVASRNVPGNYTSTNYTVNFGTIPAGNYMIRVASPEDGDDDSGNYYFYY